MSNVISQAPEVNNNKAQNSEPVTPSVTDAVTAGCDGNTPAKAAECLAVTDVTANRPEGSSPETGADLLDEITQAIRRYVVLSLAEAQMTALWTTHALTIDAHQHSPRLAITSPIPNCGKTTLCSVIALLTGGQMFSNITAAGFFRMVNEEGPVTMLVDELDTFLADSKQSINILNSGHYRRGAYVVRAESNGQGYDPRKFSTWAPVAFGLIGKLPAASLESRSLPIRLQRKRRGERVESLDRPTEQAALDALKIRTAHWGASIIEQLRGANPPLPDCLFNRNRDNWRPLVAIADAAGGHWRKTARAIAEQISGESEDPSEGVMLLSDIRRIFSDKGADKLSTDSLLSALCRDEDRPWHDYHEEGHGIDSKQLARLLKLFGIYSERIRPAGQAQCRGYVRAGFNDAFARYLPKEAECDPLPQSSVTPVTFSRSSDLQLVAASHAAVTRDVTAAIIGGAT